ncbi:hypothetical protein LPB248_01340 [Flavobacterium sp. LPB0248]|uniref:hypothetical protein n=1 Tax=Flavobacterium sp. LPB0248 TaxID=2614441 RepID=UPI0015A6988E|nr:hypothetical protein [Flavobacterium sp. LPB0248]QLC64963.1 hypothetical protein LPB248_01340 [Flavobacterium sp. LPB0248]
MKKKVFLAFIIFTAFKSVSQNKIELVGNVGIGTLAPQSKLHVNNGDNSYGTILATSSESEFSLYAKSLYTQPVYSEAFRLGLKHNNTEENGFISFYRGNSTRGGFLGFSTNGFERLKIDVNGNVGIGTSLPKQKVTIVGDQIARDQGGPVNGQNSTALLRLQSSPGGAGEVLDFGMNIKSYGWIQPQDFNDPNAFYDLILNAKGGNVGIGTINPNSKLAVNGTIHSKEVKVDMKDWSDFVFKKEYNLPTLEEVEKHIAEKGHLKNIPKEEEVLKNGINLGEMNAKLLQKIEELTLYIIEIKKENTLLKNNQIEFQNTILELINTKQK